jgi:hypothetical protein
MDMNGHNLIKCDRGIVTHSHCLFLSFQTRVFACAELLLTIRWCPSSPFAPSLHSLLVDRQKGEREKEREREREREGEGEKERERERKRERKKERKKERKRQWEGGKDH